MSREKHPLAGSPVELTDGPYKGRYFIVVDWLQNQFHGKAMENIHKVHPEITGEVVKRKGLDDRIVWGKLYPLQTLVAVHDDDMLKVEPKTKEKIDLKLISGGKDDTGRSSEEDSGAAGSAGDERCGVSSGTSDAEGPGGDTPTDETAGPAGSTDSGPKSSDSGKTRSRSRTRRT